MRFPEFSGEWEIYPLTDFMSFKNGMNPDAKRFGRGTKFISVMDILNNQFICYDNIRASVEVVDGDIETYGVNYGDILFQRSSETLEDVGQAMSIWIANPQCLVVLLFVEKVKVTIILCFSLSFGFTNCTKKDNRKRSRSTAL